MIPSNFSMMTAERQQIPRKNYLHIISLNLFQRRKIEMENSFKIPNKDDPKKNETKQDGKLPFLFKDSIGQIRNQADQHGKLALNKKDSNGQIGNQAKQYRKLLLMKKGPKELDDLFALLGKQYDGISYLVYAHLQTHENQGFKKFKLYYNQCQRVVKDAEEIIVSCEAKNVQNPINFALNYSLANYSSEDSYRRKYPYFRRSSLRSMTSLTNLQIPLNFVRNAGITNKGLINLQKQVGWRRNPLENLDLLVNEHENRSHDWFNMIMSRVSKHFLQLQNLAISLSCCFQVTDKTLKRLRIGRMRYLKHLDLDFKYCYGITSTQVNQFFYCIGRRLINLEDLTINFSRCYPVLDSSLATFGHALATGLNNLKRLTLFFETCHSISDKGLRNLVFLIKRTLPNLIFLSLSFQGCENITDNGLKYLGIGIQEYMTNLKSIQLNFKQCPGVSKIAKENLAQKLSFAPETKVQ